MNFGKQTQSFKLYSCCAVSVLLSFIHIYIIYISFPTPHKSEHSFNTFEELITLYCNVTATIIILTLTRILPLTIFSYHFLNRYNLYFLSTIHKSEHSHVKKFWVLTYNIICSQMLIYTETGWCHNILSLSRYRTYRALEIKCPTRQGTSLFGQL